MLVTILIIILKALGIIIGYFVLPIAAGVFLGLFAFSIEKTVRWLRQKL